MQRDEVIAEFTKRFKEDILNWFDKSPKRVYVDIRPESIRPVADFLFHRLGARFNIASGVDTPDCIEILYHFTLEAINLLVSVRVKLDKKRPVIESLAPSIEATNWIEREIHELLGVEFTGHPDMRRLLLPDQWPEGVHPLRQDYEEWDGQAVRDRGVG